MIVFFTLMQDIVSNEVCEATSDMMALERTDVIANIRQVKGIAAHDVSEWVAMREHV